jgi:hypothetical protein
VDMFWFAVTEPVGSGDDHGSEGHRGAVRRG